MIAAKRITYNLNGGSGTAPASSICMTNPCTLNSGNTNSFYRAGYQLVGWSTDPDAEDGSFSITVSGNTTVYAVWKECPAGTYKDSSWHAIDACQSCPTPSEGFEYYSESSGATTATACIQTNSITNFDADCSTGIILVHADDNTRWEENGEILFFSANAGRYINVGNNLTQINPLQFEFDGGFDFSKACEPCSGATYSAGGVVTSCTACPTATSGWTQGTGTGWSGYGQCFEYRNATSISSYCASGQLRRYASSGTTWASTATEHTTFRADPGAYVSGSGINMTCTQCSGAVYSAGGDVTSCTACPTTTVSGWNQGTGTGWESENDCYFYRRATDISSYCAAGELRAMYGQPPDGQTPTAAVIIEYEAFQADPGAIVTGSGISLTCTQCGVGEYSAGGAATSCTACPELTPGFDYTASAGASSYTECAQYTNDPSVANPNCMADDTADTVVILQTASSPTSWNGGVIAVGVVAKPGAILDSQFQNGTLYVEGRYPLRALCTQCSAGEYSPGGDVKECTACPELTPGFVYQLKKPNDAVGATSFYDCRQMAKASDVNNYCEDTEDYTGAYYNIYQATTDGVYWNVLDSDYLEPVPGAHIDSRLANSRYVIIDDGAYDIKNLCQICPDNTYSLGGTVTPSEDKGTEYLTSCTACLDNYTTTGDALTDHDSASDCKIYCDGGSYISVANATQCSNVGAGYWAPSSTISQGSVGSRNACASGLTTIGSGAGADEAGDCGRVLNVGDEKIYLRSTKKTTPSLNISINGDVFYGNMSTATKGSLRINSGGTTYSVYDDSM